MSDAEKYQAYLRKRREYNKKYYETKIKPRRQHVQTNEDVGVLRDTVRLLELELEASKELNEVYKRTNQDIIDGKY
mgnify:FL=1